MEHRRTRKARASGYTDDEIVNHLASRVPDAFKAAADAGYSSTVILDALSSAYGHTLTLTRLIMIRSPRRSNGMHFCSPSGSP